MPRQEAELGGFRPDVMMYIAAALVRWTPSRSKARRSAEAPSHRAGDRHPWPHLDINDPDKKYSLKSLPGKFSGLHLLAIMYTAFGQIDPTMDTGVEFASEYKAAMEMQGK